MFMRIVFWPLIVIAAAALFFSAIADSRPAVSPTGYTRDSVEYCWKQYERKSLSPPEKRFIARACEMMEGSAPR